MSAIRDGLVLAEVPEKRGAHAVPAAPSPIRFGINGDGFPVGHVQPEYLPGVTVACHKIILTW
jgi:hypothetical protein